MRLCHSRFICCSARGLPNRSSQLTVPVAVLKRRPKKQLKSLQAVQNKHVLTTVELIDLKRISRLMGGQMGKARMNGVLDLD